MKAKPCVLIIDDENDIIDILKYILEKQGMEVVSATCGAEALKLIESKNFSGVVSDYLMPKMSGLELLKTVRARNNNVPFIFLSGHATAIHEHEMINYGAYELLHKPDIKKVPDALQRLFKVHQELEILKKAGGEAEEFLDILLNKVS